MLAFRPVPVNYSVMVFLLGLLARLPLPVLHVLGATFGLLALLKPGHRRLLRSNLALAGMSGQVSLAAVAAGLGKSVLELPAIWKRSFPEVTHLIREVTGEDHLDAALARGQGIMLLVPHLGCWELAGLWYCARYPATALYTPPRQEWAHALMKAGRERGYGKTVPPDRGGVKALLAALRHKDAAFILPDQVSNQGEGVWAPFFKRWVYMPALPYRLTANTGASMLMLVCERLGLGKGYRLHIVDVGQAAATLEETAKQVNAKVEEYIRLMPEQYLWSYRIFRHHAPIPPPSEAP